MSRVRSIATRLRRGALAGAPLLLLALACGEEPAPPAPAAPRPVKLFEIGAGGDLARNFPGRVAAMETVDLSFRVGGPLVQLPIKEGDEVARGGLVARIDPRDFRIALDAARAERERTAADFRRFASLYEKDAVSQAQLDQARAAMEVAGARYEDAEVALADTTLRAPFTALVARRLVDNFQEVVAGQPIATLVALDQVKVEVDLPEGIVSRAVRGHAQAGRAVARIEALPGRELELTLREVALQADARTQTYRATFTMPQPEGAVVLPGMTVQVLYTPAAAAPGNGLTVPSVAVADGPGGAYVWVIDPQSMAASRRAVRTGSLIGSSDIEVLEGLTPGETIAVSAVSRLAEGMKVRRLEGQG